MTKFNKYFWTLWIPVGIFLLNFVLKIIFLDKPDLYNDEPFSVFFAQKSVSDIIRILSLGNNPPLFEIILHFWMKMFGISQFSVRFLPVIFSCVTAVFIYFIGFKHLNKKEIGLVSALIFTFAYQHFFYAQEARVYSFFVMLATMCLYLYLNILKNTEKKSNYVWLTICNLLLMYGHFFGLFIVFMEFISTYLFKSNRKKIGKKMLIVFGLTILLYLPYVSVFIYRFITSAVEKTWVESSQLSDYFDVILNTYGGNVPAVILLITLFLGIFYQWKKRPMDTKLIALWFLIPYTIMFLASFEKLPYNIPMFIIRYVLFTSIPFILTAITSLFELNINYKIKVSIASVIIILLIITFKPTVNKATIKPVCLKANELASHIPVIMTGDFAASYTYFTEQSLFKNMDGLPDSLLKRNVYVVNPNAACDVFEKLKNADSVAYLSFINDEGSLRTTLISCFQNAYPHFTTYYYQRKTNQFIMFQDGFAEGKSVYRWDKMYYLVVFKKQL